MQPSMDSPTSEAYSSILNEKALERTEHERAASPLQQKSMRRVDWRWAVAKGFLNKETNEWNEQLGGQEAYLKQRNERMNARFLNLAFSLTLIRIFWKLHAFYPQHLLKHGIIAS